MNQYRGNAIPGLPPAFQREPVASNAVLGMLIFVVVEVMLFAGMISAFMIVRTSALGEWPPPGQPRLPAGETAINTVALLLSGVALYLAHGRFRRSEDMQSLLGVSIGLGAFFLVFQGYEWLALIREGLTLTSSNHGSFFYMIVGTHALHAIAALGVLIYAWLRNARQIMLPDQFYAAQIFWYFVVVLWPILYWRVYL